MTTEETGNQKTILEGSSLKGYRNLNDIENFYRFVYENKVRKEAKLIFQAIIDIVAPKKKARKPRAKKAKKLKVK